MSKKPLLLALLSLLVSWPAVFPGSPAGPSGRLVLDEVPILEAEVRRLEKEVARDKSLAGELDVARARMAAAQGRVGEARASWRKVIVAREERLARASAVQERAPFATCPKSRSAAGTSPRPDASLPKSSGTGPPGSRELPKVIEYWEAPTGRCADPGEGRRHFAR